MGGGRRGLSRGPTCALASAPHVGGPSAPLSSPSPPIVFFVALVTARGRIIPLSVGASSSRSAVQARRAGFTCCVPCASRPVLRAPPRAPCFGVTAGPSAPQEAPSGSSVLGFIWGKREPPLLGQRTFSLGLPRYPAELWVCPSSRPQPRRPLPSSASQTLSSEPCRGPSSP